MLRIDTHINQKFLLKKLITCFPSLILVLGCSNVAEIKVAEQEITYYSESCLEGLNLNSLQNQLKNCNNLLEKNKNNLIILNDRSIIFLLMGKVELACRDVSEALALIENEMIKSNSLILNELKIRQNNCKQRLNITGND